VSTRDFIEKDYYKALGVPKNADAAEIKKAYRKLARELHPDKNPDDPRAEARFKEVSEAYDVLADDSRRREYDEARSLFGGRAFGGRGGGPGFGAGRGGGAGRGPGAASNGGAGMPFDLDDLLASAGRGGGGGGAQPGGAGLGDLFGSLFGEAGGRRTRASRRGADVETEATLDFEEAVRGVTLPLRLASPHTCPTCTGTGAAPGTTPRACPVCNGGGMVSRNQGAFSFSEPCRECRGTGAVVDTPCPDCAGSGTVTSSRTLTVRIPPGVQDGQRIKLAGQGAPGERGAPPGDLYVVVHVQPGALFGRQGDDLTLTLPVTLPEAALGATVSVPTLDGSVTLRIPPGTPSGKTLRVRGRGVPRRDGSAGDLLVTTDVVVPRTLSPQAKAALEAYAEAMPDDPRASLHGRPS